MPSQPLFKWTHGYGEDVYCLLHKLHRERDHEAYWDDNDNDLYDKVLRDCGDDEEGDDGEEGEDFLTAMNAEKELLGQGEEENFVAGGLFTLPKDETEESFESPAAFDEHQTEMESALEFKDDTEMEGYGFKIPAMDTDQHDPANNSLVTKELFPPSNDISITYRKSIPFSSATWDDTSLVKTVTKIWACEQTYSFKILYPRLYCKECGLDRYICVYDDTFIDVHSKGDIWYDTEFINVFSFLVCHGSHTLKTTLAPKKSPRLVVVVFPQHSWSTAKINVMQEPLPDKMVLLLWEKSHYAVMEVIVSSRSMNIYDGLNKSLSAWYPHAEYILKMLGIIKAPFKSPAVSFSLCQCQPPLSLVMGKMIGIFQLKSSLPNMMVIIVDQLHASRSLKCFI